jgi:predicted RNA binding protein YcfA (HicA-like mRNA interferase family)
VWPASKPKKVLKALQRIGWSVKRQRGGSHRVLARPGWPDYEFSFHDRDEIGPRMLSRIAKETGLTPGDLQGKGQKKNDTGSSGES